MPLGGLHLSKFYHSGKFINLTSVLTLKSIYNPHSLILFWIKARAEFPLVGCKAFRVFGAVCDVILVRSRFFCGSSNQVEVPQ